MLDAKLLSLIKLQLGWLPDGVDVYSSCDSLVLVNDQFIAVGHLIAVHELVRMCNDVTVHSISRNDWERSPNPYIRTLHNDAVRITLR